MKAFPITSGQYLSGKLDEVGGMDLRDYFAAHAPDAPDQWITDSLGDGHHIAEAICSWRFFYADTMIEARNDD